MMDKFMVDHYEKVAFVWNEPAKRVQVPDRLSFKPYDSIDFHSFADLVACVMNDSIDRHDKKITQEPGALQAVNKFLDKADEAFEYQSDWWQLAFDNQGELVGFILPVLFRGAEKYGLGEGTIYYMGVSPEHRGNNYVYDLLCCGTALLQKAGVWWIYSDTDVLNAPMIKAFLDVGYERFGSPKNIPL